MKRKFRSYSSYESGFVLPFVLVISLIIIILITTTVKIYDSERTITKKLQEHLEVSTFVQIGFERFKSDFSDINETKGKRVYSLPNGGKVNIEFEFLDDDLIGFNYLMTLSEGGKYEVSQLYPIDILDETSEVIE